MHTGPAPTNNKVADREGGQTMINRCRKVSRELTGRLQSVPFENS